jgi:hypothetical protein
MSGDMYAFSVLIGSTSLIIGLVLKKLPEAWTKKLPIFIDEKKEVKQDFMMKFYQQQAEKTSQKSHGVNPE